MADDWKPEYYRRLVIREERRFEVRAQLEAVTGHNHGAYTAAVWVRFAREMEAGIRNREITATDTSETIRKHRRVNNNVRFDSLSF